MKMKQIKIEEATLFVYRMRKNLKSGAQKSDPTITTITATKTIA
jgi:hypothetical protein